MSTAAPFGVPLLVTALVVTAVSLRPALTAVGPLMDDIRTHLGLAAGPAGLLGTLALVAFAAAAPVAPRLARRWGIEGTLLAGVAIIAAGIALRSVPEIAAVFAGTLVLGLGISLGNVLLPSLVKRSFAGRAGIMTSLYTTAMALAAAIGSGVAVPVADAFDGVAGLEGWQASLGWWALPALATVPLWAAVVRRERSRAQNAALPAAPPARLWRSRLALAVTGFMGLQSLAFYVAITWLPSMLADEGFTAAEAGTLLLVAQVVGLGASAAMPVVAGRAADQRLLAAGTGLTFVIGYGGLLLAPMLAIPWTVILGIGFGASISLALMLFVLRSDSPHEAAELSAMAQSVGYLLAATGPVVVGVLHDVTGGWDAALGLLMVVAAAQTLAGLRAGSGTSRL